MKLVGFEKDTYDYTKDGQRIVGTSVTLYFSYKIPSADGAGVACKSYPASGKLSRQICQGQKPLSLGADYEIIPDEYGKVANILPIDTGGKEKVKNE